MATQSQSLDNSGFPGQADQFALNPDMSQEFMVRQIMSELQTATVVKIVKVSNSGGVSPVGLVDVQPLVNLVDGAGNATTQGTVHNVPYFRLQGGANAVIMDPQVGDIGVCVFSSRDISSVKTVKGTANPGSRRRYSISDGLYVGGFLNGTPSQYVSFSTTGITLHSPTKVTIEAPNVAITGSSLTHNGKNIGSTHTHGGVQTGASNTGVPT